MRIVLAPYMPLILEAEDNIEGFLNLCLHDLPSGIILIVPDKWEEIISRNSFIAGSYELFSLLLQLPVVELSHSNKAAYIRVNPDILNKMEDSSRETVRQQLYALSQYDDARRVFAGSEQPVNIFTVSYDRHSVVIDNYSPRGIKSFIDYYNSLRPRLEQLKHFQRTRRAGGEEISPFSAYDKGDETYANELLQKAFEEHQGDVNDRTYLYTYDRKNKTYVQFRPGRNGVYHGMDIDTETARMKAPDLVHRYHR